MTTQVALNTKGRSLTMASNVFGKLLHLAHKHGWQSEKLHDHSTRNNWETELVFREVSEYMPGSVSPQDAQGLSRALRHLLDTGDTSMSPTLYLGLLVLLRVSNRGGFAVNLDNHTTPQAPAK